MKVKIYILFIISLASACYGIFAFWSMVLNCQAPFYIECVGVKLQKNIVIAISNNKPITRDTICFNYPQSKSIMPSSLGYIKFNNDLNTYILQNSPCIYNPDKVNPSNYFYAFAHTLNDHWYSQSRYFSANEIIFEDILITNGIKYISAFGTKENRVSVQLKKFNNDTYIKFKDDGISVRYLAKANTKNIYDVFLNQPVNSNNKFIFKFDNTTTETNHYIIHIRPSTFSFFGTVNDKTGKSIISISTANNTFDVGGYLFNVTPKYARGFAVLYGLFLLFLIAFQSYFFHSMLKYKSEVYASLYSLRILINSLVFLGVPIFLISYTLDANRSIYLLLVIFLNLSYLTPKNILHKARLLGTIKFSNCIIYTVLLLLVIILWKFTSSELFLGIIPILHIQKIVLLIVIFVTQIKYFSKFKFGKWLRLIFIISFSILVSVLTSDLGSCIYTSLSMLLIELIKKSIKLRYVVLSTIVLIASILLIYKVNPSLLTGTKLYRVVAPYSTPSSDYLKEAKQADRETYAGINYVLKNRINGSLPTFNKLIVPVPFRSTMHTDLSFLWSFAFGSYTFVIIFACVIIALCRELLLLLYLCTRIVRINKDKYFALPVSREGELVRFYLGFTLIQFVYPIGFSLLLLPLTGQSLCALAVSNWEIIFLTFLLVVLHSVFTNTTYFTKRSEIQYAFEDAKKSIRVVVAFFLMLMVVGFACKYYVVLINLVEPMEWKKYNKNIELQKNIPHYSDKIKIVKFASNIIGEDDLTAVSTKKKTILKELASLYYTNKPFNHSVYESRKFNISSSKILEEMSVDSLFKMKRNIISGKYAPFGLVYSMSHVVNNKAFNSVTNKYYYSIPAGAETINADLTAECSKALESHLSLIGIKSNIGSVMIVENKTGKVLANSSFPLLAATNSNEHYYFIGSLKKILVAYAALSIDSSYRSKIYGGKSFQEFLQYSDDYYAAALLRDLLKNHREKFGNVLENDFDLPLYSLTDDAYLDALPNSIDFKHELNRNSIIYRESIGQQKPYQFIDVMQWYARIESGLKVKLHDHNDTKTYDSQSLNDVDRKFMLTCLNKVLYGTASVVRYALEKNHIKTNNIICKTGTSEKSDQNSNSASSFILSNHNYTVGIMLNGTIPENMQNLAAKDLFVTLIPILIKYNILQ